jgi:copper(I)-binding protein
MRARSFTVLVTLVAAFVVATVTLTAQASKVDVTGKWMFNVETAAGSGTPTITLKQDGDKLTGHYSGQLGEADLTGTVKGQEIAFKFTVDAQGNNLDCTYTGTIEGKDALKGKVNIAGLADGTFTAKKQ